MWWTGGEGSGASRRGAGRRWGRGMPVLFLLLSLAVAGFGALEAYRAQRSHAATATDLLRDYSEFAAWSYERNSWELFRSAVDNHLAIAYSNRQFALGQATEQCLLTILEPDVGRTSCDCAPTLAGGYSFFTRLGEPVSESRWVGELPESGHQAAVIEATQQHARSGYEEDWTFAVLHLAGVDDPPVIAYTRLASPTTIIPGFEVARDTVLYGFEIDRKRLSGLYARVLVDEVLLPSTLTRDRRNDEVISVQVYGPDESLLYASGPETEMAFAAPIDRQEIFGGGEIRASVLPNVADELIIGGLPKDRTGVLVLVFSLAGALAILAIVQMRREDQLALLRQDFVASVSHELRTPLAQVRLFTETLKLGRTKNQAQRAWALDNIDRETRRLSALVENILHFSRAERGVQSLDREPADVSTVVRDAIDSFELLLPAQKGRIVSDLCDGLVAELHADSLRQVVLNLLDNAVRYGPTGQTIRVSGESDGDRIRIVVDDEGPGVRPDERRRIFEPFQRGEQSVGTVVVGSGIGLAVVSEIVAAHDGEVHVEDAPTGGARFVIELPAVHTALPEHFSAPAGAREDTTGAA